MTLSLSALADQFYAFMAGRNAPGTITEYRRHIDRFVTTYAEVPIDELRRHHLATWATKWHPIQAVQRLFAWAHTEMELIGHNPFRHVKRPRLAGRKRVLTPREIAALTRNADANFRRVMLALRESICRPQELRSVTWECIRWEGEFDDALPALAAGQAYFELIEFKSRKQRLDPNGSRVILISAKLGRLLLWMARRSPDLAGPIFLNRAGKPWSSNALRLRMRRLRKRAGIEADARGEKIVAYSFRHTGATEACVKGVPDKILADLMGHTSTRTTSRYQHVSRTHLREAMQKLEEAKKRKPG